MYWQVGLVSAIEPNVIFVYGSGFPDDRCNPSYGLRYTPGSCKRRTDADHLPAGFRKPSRLALRLAGTDLSRTFSAGTVSHQPKP